MNQMLPQFSIWSLDSIHVHVSSMRAGGQDVYSHVFGCSIMEEVEGVAE